MVHAFVQHGPSQPWLFAVTNSKWTHTQDLTEVSTRRVTSWNIGTFMCVFFSRSCNFSCTQVCTHMWVRGHDPCFRKKKDINKAEMPACRGWTFLCVHAYVIYASESKKASTKLRDGMNTSFKEKSPGFPNEVICHPWTKLITNYFITAYYAQLASCDYLMIWVF